jgi:hypothetical protein
MIDTDKNYTLTLSNSLTNLYSLMYSEIEEIFESIGEPIDLYVLKFLPFAIERIDGKPIPQIVTTQIRNIF